MSVRLPLKSHLNSLIPLVLFLSIACALPTHGAESRGMVIDARNPRSIEMRSLVSNPKAFSDKVVSFSALLHVEGGDLMLYENEGDARAENLERGVYAKTTLEAPPYGKTLNDHWVRVTGRVRAIKDGLYPAELLLLDIVDIAAATMANSNLHLVLKNDAAQSVRCILTYYQGGASIIRDIPPGISKRFPFKKFAVKMNTKLGKTVFSGELNPGAISKQWVNPQEHTVYYRFNGRQLELVAPDVGRHWNYNRGRKTG